MEKCRFAIHWRKNLHFLAERKVPKLLCYFLSYKKVKAVSLFREASMFSAYEKQKPQQPYAFSLAFWAPKRRRPVRGAPPHKKETCPRRAYLFA